VSRRRVPTGGLSLQFVPAPSPAELEGLVQTMSESAARSSAQDSSRATSRTPISPSTRARRRLLTASWGTRSRTGLRPDPERVRRCSR
jgi:hypothetical protein